MIFLNYQNLMRSGSKRNLIISAGFFLVFVVLFLTKLTPVEKKICEGLPGNAVILDLEFGYSAEKAYDILDKLGVSGRATYLRNILTVDMAFPIIYGIFLTIITAFLLNKIKAQKKAVNILLYIGPAASISDIVENIFISVLIKNFPVRLNALAQTAGIFTDIKFIFTALWFFAFLILLIFLVHKAVRKTVRE